MSATNIRDSKSWFDVLETAKRCQTAVMTLAPGEESGPKQNEHPESEQVLYLVEGELEAEIGELLHRMRQQVDADAERLDLGRRLVGQVLDAGQVLDRGNHHVSIAVWVKVHDDKGVVPPVNHQAVGRQRLAERAPIGPGTFQVLHPPGRPESLHGLRRLFLSHCHIIG